LVWIRGYYVCRLVSKIRSYYHKLFSCIPQMYSERKQPELHLGKLVQNFIFFYSYSSLVFFLALLLILSVKSEILRCAWQFLLLTGYVHSDMPNHQDYQSGHSIHGPVPHSCQNHLHNMQADQIRVPHQQLVGSNLVHGVPSATSLPLDPRMLAVPLNLDHTFGQPLHPPPINQFNNAVLRIPPYQVSFIFLPFVLLSPVVHCM
jgi:hypothetical protein